MLKNVNHKRKTGKLKGNNIEIVYIKQKEIALWIRAAAKHRIER